MLIELGQLSYFSDLWPIAVPLAFTLAKWRFVWQVTFFEKLKFALKALSLLCIIFLLIDTLCDLILSHHIPKLYQYYNQNIANYIHSDK